MAATVRETYERDGYVVARQVLPADLIAEASAHIDWLQKRHPELRAEQLGHRLMTHDAFWVRLISDSRLLDVAEAFIGPDIALFASHYISKPPFDGQPVLWHQDGSYWPLKPMQVVTLWLAVDDSTPENGCMRVIPRTHGLEIKPHQARQDQPNVLSSSIDDSLVDESKAVDVILEAGDVSIHHPNIIHGSKANRSPKRRAGLTIRYIPTSTRIVTDQPWPSCFLLRGKAVPGVNDYRPWPAFDAATSVPFTGCDAWNQRLAAARA
ncbi:MAG: phytanoyl-CoA dioxygenase family protein [Lentisphaerae bacterium]|nr:phytanoyl-CoA dioxygenase family protein [Lentisphaerota bacterium]